MCSSVNGKDGVVAEKVAILDAGAQYGKVCWFSYVLFKVSASKQQFLLAKEIDNIECRLYMMAGCQVGRSPSMLAAYNCEFVYQLL